MAAILRDAVFLRTRPGAIPPAMITMTESINGFRFLSYIEYGAPLGDPSCRRSSAIMKVESDYIDLCRATISIDNVYKRTRLSLYVFSPQHGFEEPFTPLLYIWCQFSPPSPSPPLMSRLSPCTSSCQIPRV